MVLENKKEATKFYSAVPGGAQRPTVQHDSCAEIASSKDVLDMQGEQNFQMHVYVAARQREWNVIYIQYHPDSVTLSET